MAKDGKKKSEGNTDFNVKKFNDKRYMDFKVWCVKEGITIKHGIFLGMGAVMKGGK